MRQVSCFFEHLCLRALGAHAGGSHLDHLGQLGDGLGRGVSSLGQFLLAGCGSSNQQLGVLHQRFGRLQDALPVGTGHSRVTRRIPQQKSANQDGFPFLKPGSVQSVLQRLIKNERHEPSYVVEVFNFRARLRLVCLVSPTCDQRRSPHSRG